MATRNLPGLAGSTPLNIADGSAVPLETLFEQAPVSGTEDDRTTVIDMVGTQYNLIHAQRIIRSAPQAVYTVRLFNERTFSGSASLKVLTLKRVGGEQYEIEYKRLIDLRTGDQIMFHPHLDENGQEVFSLVAVQDVSPTHLAPVYNVITDSDEPMFITDGYIFESLTPGDVDR